MGRKRSMWLRERHIRFLVGSKAGKKPLRRRRRVWEDNNKMGLTEIVCGYVYKIDFARGKNQ
jgi:hypothetical protein